jgi:SAM-dependent methyltransferase
MTSWPGQSWSGRSRADKRGHTMAPAFHPSAGHFLLTLSIVTRQFSPASERNREPILAVLRDCFARCGRVLEIGSGTGQHAIFFAEQLPHLVWQTSDVPENHASIHAWISETSQSNVLPPLTLDVSGAWPHETFDAVFSANTCHIMSWREVEHMFAGIGRVLLAGGVLCLYGPFNYAGKFTSDSNARFDAMLRARGNHMGIRDFEAIDRLAASQGLILKSDIAMPANNRALVWQAGT